MRAFLALLITLPYLVIPCGTKKALAVTIASDDASQPAYTNGWQTGDNGGSGFGPWVLGYSGITSGLFHAPQFIDRGPLAGNSLGAPAFALTTSDRDFFSDTSEARRTFTAPLAVGQTFGIDLDGSELDPKAMKYTTGNTFELIASDNRERFGLFTNNDYHNNNWTATGDIDTGIPAARAVHLDFTLATANTYNLVIRPIGGGTPLFSQTGAPLTGISGTGINSFRISAYGTGSSANGTKELFFDNLTLTGPGLRGDYNNDRIVNAADYVMWRTTLGQTGAGLAADGNGNNRIDSGDFSVWRANFGRTATGGGQVSSVPEPATRMLIIATAAWLLRRRR